MRSSGVWNERVAGVGGEFDGRINVFQSFAPHHAASASRARAQSTRLPDLRNPSLSIFLTMPPLDPKQRTMADAQLVIDGAELGAPVKGSLFANKTFFLVQRLPLRSTFLEQVKANGGRVTKLEAQADHVIADHKRKDTPPGSISYTWIEHSIRDGTLADPDDHIAGPPVGAIRAVGSGAPVKGTRTPFTAEDDQVLYQWVQECLKKGLGEKGNEIYQQLEAVNNRHTFQSWRDRYIKKLSGKPPVGANVAVTVPVETPPSPPHAPDQLEAQPQEATVKSTQAQPTQTARTVKSSTETTTDQSSWERKFIASSAQNPASPLFTDEDFNLLLEMSVDIQNVPVGRYDEAWAAWAAGDSGKGYSAGDWRKFYEAKVQPAHLKEKEERKARQAQAGEISEVSEDDEMADTQRSNGRSPFTRRHRRVPSNELPPSSLPLKAIAVESPHVDRGDESSAEKLQPNTQLSPAARAALRFSFGQEEREKSPKRKRPPTKIELLHKYGRKKPRTNDLAAPSVPHASQHNRPLQDARQTKFQAVTLSREKEVKDEEDTDAFRNALPESNHVFGQKTQEAALGVDRAPDFGDFQATSNISTSDANRAAAQQLAAEATVDLSSEKYDEDEDSIASQVPASESYLATSDANNLVQSQLLQENGDPLTQENLAHAQMLQRPAVRRSADIPEDDEMQDQADFIDYLQNATKSAGLAINMDAIPSDLADQQQLNDGDLQQPPSEVYSTNADGPPHRPRDALPPDSDEDELPNSVRRHSAERDRETYRTGIFFSSSPARSRRQDESQNQRFETQIQNPPLADDDVDIDEAFENNLDWPSSPQRSRRVKYPDLPEEVPETMQSQITYPQLPLESESLQFESQLPGQGFVRFDDTTEARVMNETSVHQNEAQSYSLQRQIGEAEEYMPIEEDDEEDEIEDEIDFSVAEPEGGFPSSHPRSTASQLEQSVGDVARTSAAKVEQLLEDEESPPPLARPQGLVGRNAIVDGEVEESIEYGLQEPDEEERLQYREQPEDVIELSSQSSSSSSSSNLSWLRRAPTAIGKARAMDTQAILEAETQQPDLDMPLPPESDEEPMSQPPPQSTRKLPTTEQSQQLQSQRSQPVAESSQLAIEDVETFIARWSARGYQESNIVDALQMTCMDAPLAEIVFIDMESGRGVPKDIPGVWTEEEDAVLEGTDARALKRLEIKHGWGWCERRLNFLKELREADE